MSSGSRRLRNAASSGNLDRVRWLLTRGHSPNRVTTKGTSALHCAVINGHSEVVKELLAAEANPNLARKTWNRWDGEGVSTPLKDACDASWRRDAIIELLAAAGGNPTGCVNSRWNLPDPPARLKALGVKESTSKWPRTKFSSTAVHILYGMRHWVKLQRRTWTLREHHTFPRPVREWITTVMLCARRIADVDAALDHPALDFEKSSENHDDVATLVDDGAAKKGYAIAAAKPPPVPAPCNTTAPPAVLAERKPNVRSYAAVTAKPPSKLPPRFPDLLSKQPPKIVKDSKLAGPKVPLPPMPTEMWCMVLTMCSQAGMKPSPQIDPEWVHWACVPEKSFMERLPYEVKPAVDTFN